LQKGNLISCTARVEITVRDAHAENILIVDRQTSVRGGHCGANRREEGP